MKRIFYCVLLVLVFGAGCNREDDDLGTGGIEVRFENQTGKTIINYDFIFGNQVGRTVTDNLPIGGISPYYRFAAAEWCNFQIDIVQRGGEELTGSHVHSIPQPLDPVKHTVILYTDTGINNTPYVAYTLNYD